jgi:hypothetical protein
MGKTEKCKNCTHIRFIGEPCIKRGVTRLSYDACKDFEKSNEFSDLKLSVKIGLFFIRIGKQIINLNL